MNEPARIGDNRPPPYEAMSLHIEDLFALVSDSTAAGKCETDAQEAALDGLLDDCARRRKPPMPNARRKRSRTPMPRKPSMTSGATFSSAAMRAWTTSRRC